MNLLIETLETIRYDNEQWKWFHHSSEKLDIDWNFVLGLLFGIGYLIFATAT